MKLTPQQRLTLGTLESPVGHFGLFDICSNSDILSLSFQGVDQFIDWLGFRFTDEYTVKRNFVAWSRAAFSSGAATAGWLADPCADANGVDYGVCDFTLTDFARLRRNGPVRDVTMNNVRRCINQPRFRIDGSQIMDVDEFDMRLATEVILSDLRAMLINGNKSTAGQFDGLQRLVKTGYTNSDASRCELMDSIVVNWNSNPVAGGTGVTVNGNAVAATASLIDGLLWTHRQVKHRIAASPELSAQPRRVGDTIILLPGHLTTCILDAYTCWSVCPGGEFRPVDLQTYEARNFRDRLNGGLYGFGQITLDGDTIPLMGFDYGGNLFGGSVRVTSLTRTGATATATTAYAHGLTTGQSVTITGATGTEYNVTAVVTVTGATTFTYTVAGTPTSPDPSTTIMAGIANTSDLYYLTGSLGNIDLMDIEVLNLSGATDIIANNLYDVTDGGRFLTWLNNDNTCIERVVETRPRLLSWAPWANARFQNVACSQFGPAYSNDPLSLNFPVKTFTTAGA